ncbi:hypothetical protein ES702_03531 [subsurface metagenome]
MLAEDYFNSTNKILDKIYKTQLDNIIKSADIIAESIIGKGAVYIFGATHAGIITEELFFRAGGLIPVNPIFASGLTTLEHPISNTSKIERLEGYGKIIVEGSGITNKDVLIVHSVSGRNPVSIEVAMEGKKKGASLIVLTSLKFSKSVKSRHYSGKRLFEVGADVILDNCGVIGDAVAKVKGMKQKTGSTSTICGCYIMNAVMVQVIENLIKKGLTPPVFISANVDGGDEFNKKLLEEYKSRIKYL